MKLTCWFLKVSTADSSKYAQPPPPPRNEATNSSSQLNSTAQLSQQQAQQPINLIPNINNFPFFFHSMMHLPFSIYIYSIFIERDRLIIDTYILRLPVSVHADFERLANSCGGRCCCRSGEQSTSAAPTTVLATQQTAACLSHERIRQSERRRLRRSGQGLRGRLLDVSQVIR